MKETDLMSSFRSVLRANTLMSSVRLMRPAAMRAGVTVFTGCTLSASFSSSQANSTAQRTAAPPVSTAPPVSAAQWNSMIVHALPAVVSIKVNRVRAFDTVQAGSVQATGFVVDKERGLILTNRHVAGPGPIVAEAIFANNEEVPCHVAYYDPEHDFALLRFEPSAVQHMQLVELPLSPEMAEVGSEIVIIGNNAGEKSCSKG